MKDHLSGFLAVYAETLEITYLVILQHLGNSIPLPCLVKRLVISHRELMRLKIHEVVDSRDMAMVAFLVVLENVMQVALENSFALTTLFILICL